MKLRNRQVVLVSIMLFSMFFGAGNLIFPPFLGQNAGDHTVGAFLGFLITAVVLPVLGVVVVAKFDGLDRLASKVGKRFAFVFTIGGQAFCLCLHHSDLPLHWTRTGHSQSGFRPL